ncbi:MAG: TetR/AcrR family transcriptional regulator [Gammaproteobacteria bacterium]|nr:TetR/AcrR family transcriptional regulator [Gammaproteobacteria bacterium]
MPRSSDKRERLVDSAKTLIHKQGFNQTSLADIAYDSGVPLGNVYYYFKTKEDIASAVISEHDEGIKDLMRGFEETEPDPRKRLVLFLDFANEMREIAAKYGCPVGSLCQELDKNRSALSDKIDAVLIFQLEWVTEQFVQMGKPQANALGQKLIASLSGTNLLANALNDPHVVEVQIKQLKEWVVAL